MRHGILVPGFFQTTTKPFLKINLLHTRYFDHVPDMVKRGVRPILSQIVQLLFTQCYIESNAGLPLAQICEQAKGVTGPLFR